MQLSMTWMATCLLLRTMKTLYLKGLLQTPSVSTRLQILWKASCIVDSLKVRDTVIEAKHPIANYLLTTKILIQTNLTPLLKFKCSMNNKENRFNVLFLSNRKRKERNLNKKRQSTSQICWKTSSIIRQICMTWTVPWIPLNKTWFTLVSTINRSATENTLMNLSMTFSIKC